MKRSILAGLAVAAVLAFGAAPASAATSITFGSFPQVSGEDRIDMTYRDGAVPSWAIKVCLRTASWMTWSKGIEAYHRAKETPWWGGGATYVYKKFNSVHLWGSYHGPECMQFGTGYAIADYYWAPSDSERAGKLVFGKAKILGLYTQMYELHWTRAMAVGGREYTFTWVHD